MAQKFKTIYYADFPAESSQKKNLTLAFGEKDVDLYEAVKTFSSHELRELLGHATYAALQTSAGEDQLPVNAYCIRRLREKAHADDDSGLQLSFAGLLPSIELPVEPIQATFRGGQAEPLHRWYPYLEGYSPAFVQQVLAEFAPDAERILDPFAGSGTTPLTAGRMGRQAWYCEINPVLQYVVEAKAAALILPLKVRRQIATALRQLAGDAHTFVAGAEPDCELAITYGRVFGASRFFAPAVYDQVLRLRTALDGLACGDEHTARFASVAALSALLPASLLIRRGDVRYKTEAERARNQTELLPAFQAQLLAIAADLDRLIPVTHQPIFLCEDARSLAKLPSLAVDAVVTSPPYLNGTNYFRNSKIELWFLRCLRSAADLADFRFRTVTAGINDVTVGKTAGAVSHPAVAELVGRLEQSAYDGRIPKMVASYFADMGAIFQAVVPHLSKNGVVLVDIGDSVYGNVHVPTDTLLAAVLKEQGLQLRHEIVLRKRMSRGGLSLRQVLLVLGKQDSFRFSAPAATVSAATVSAATVSAATVSAATAPASWRPDWETFKATLPHQQGVYAKRNWGHPLHSLCSYQGKMKPALAAHLVKTFVPVGGSMLDPFAGVGTIPFEAALAGARAWAFDISPAALCIARAKLGSPTAQECERTIAGLEEYLTTHRVDPDMRLAAEQIRFNGPLPSYFAEQTFGEILLARAYFKLHPPQSAGESLVMASLLHILHGNRPYALSRRSHPITPFAPSGPSEYRALLPRLREKVERSLAAGRPAAFTPGQVYAQDATLWWPREVDHLDAIITSPPFFDSTRFYLANWMRLWFCGWEAADFRSQPLAFVDERQKSTFGVYESIFAQARERLKLGGVLVLHLGKSKKCDMAANLARVAQPWFRVADVFDESVVHCESHGIKDKGTVTSHQYLVLD